MIVRFSPLNSYLKKTSFDSLSMKRLLRTFAIVLLSASVRFVSVSCWTRADGVSLFKLLILLNLRSFRKMQFVWSIFGSRCVPSGIAINEENEKRKINRKSHLLLHPGSHHRRFRSQYLSWCPTWASRSYIFYASLPNIWFAGHVCTDRASGEIWMHNNGKNVLTKRRANSGSKEKTGRK